MLGMTDDWPNLARHAKKRRDQLRLKQSDLPGLSPATVTKIENAAQSTYWDSTLVSLEVALGWAPGSVESILAGGEPTLLGGVERPDTASATGVVSGPPESHPLRVESDLAEVRERVERLEILLAELVDEVRKRQPPVS